VGPEWGGCYCHVLPHLLSLFLFLHSEVPTHGPLWLPFWGTVSLSPGPRASAPISGAAPQTLPQAHILLQVRFGVLGEVGEGCLQGISAESGGPDFLGELLGETCSQ
jgi:hypothetical protein